MYNKLPQTTKDCLSEYTMKGWILKKVSEDMKPHLDGVLNGMLAEVHPDESVTIFKLKIAEKGSTIVPFLKWKDDKIQTLTPARGRGTGIEYVVPAGRSQGVFVTKNNRILVGLINK